MIPDYVYLSVQQEINILTSVSVLEESYTKTKKKTCFVLVCVYCCNEQQGI